MKLLLDLLVLCVIGYYAYKFIQVLLKMKQTIIFPQSNEELEAIRKYPQKPVDPPIFSKQKVGIIIYTFALVFVLGIFCIARITGEIDWTFYVLLFLPLSYSNDLLNLFAVVDDGVLAGSRFVPWTSIKSFQFIIIDINHKFYGYSKETNGGYELIIKAKGRSISCIVTSETMKEKLTTILNDHIALK